MNDKAVVKESTIFMITALAIKPDYSPALTDLAIAYAILGNKEESKQYAMKAISEMDKDSDYKDKYLRDYLLNIAQGNLENI